MKTVQNELLHIHTEIEEKFEIKEIDERAKLDDCLEEHRKAFMNVKNTWQYIW